MKRPIIEIDEEKCNGCGKCVLDCAEGALAIIDGKAKLISDVFCDGLGACLNCPEGALRLVERDAPEFDEEAALAAKAKREGAAAPHRPHGGCPGSMARTLTPLVGGPATAGAGGDLRAQVPTWPIQLRLLPPTAPFLKGANILLAAHCAGFALPNLHTEWMRGRVPVIACPKLEDNEVLKEKLTAIIKNGGIAGITVLRMSVPCCGGLERLVHSAIEAAGSTLTPETHIVQL
ncbi:ATP-binding protein [Desulfovibrio sp.]|uniref:ATP-binding protein n=1 Tax=Desulfovibrio sp. TaxID=885 RepID=UPI0035AFE4EA